MLCLPSPHTHPPHTLHTHTPLTQLASAIQYLHSCNIIYRDLKSDNVLVWRFPDPLEAIPKPPPGQQLGMETVFVKLSDYGISQFAATQGARGLVGTPGFIAPEILKYQGREVSLPYTMMRINPPPPPYVHYDAYQPTPLPRMYIMRCINPPPSPVCTL